MSGGHRPRGGKRRMNKYELIIVLSAKLEDEERAAAIEKVQNYVTRFGGTVEGGDEWGRRSSLMRSRRQQKLSTTLLTSRQLLTVLHRLKAMFA